MYPQSKLLWRTSPPVEAPKSGGLPPVRPHCTRRDCIPELVSLAAHLNPDAVALIAGTETVQYAALETRSDRLAAYLRSLGVTHDVAVAVCLDRSPDSVAAALAIWKAGGICVPIDPAWPADFREAVIGDAQAVILVTRGIHSPGVRFTVDLDLDDAAIARELTVFNRPPTRREWLAYIVYPGANLAGVELTHGNLLNLAFWHRRAFDVTEADRGACLDGVRCAAVEVWPYLTSGASVAFAGAPPG